MSATTTPVAPCLQARRTGRAVSEGTESARRINNPRRASSLTADPYLLHTGQLHRVSTRSMPPDVDGAAVGHCRTDMGLCHGHAACADTTCPAHPQQNAHDTQDDDVPETERDRALMLKALVGYVAFLAACAWGTWHWLSN